ncbi:MAG: VIT1/CCC1 transporter family protein [Planctomycetota bacterium]
MPSRDLEKARQAFDRKDPSASRAAHAARTGVRADERHGGQGGQYLRSAVYGGLDGIITTFAVVAGAAGASLSAGVVLILGFANLIADGLSMAIGDYLSTKAELDYQKTERQREQWEIETYPEGEQHEMIELYVAKGISEEDARTIVSIFSRNQRAWLDVMMVEELGIVESDESPVKNALVTFFSFGLFGLVPLLAYVALHLAPSVPVNRFALACAFTAATLFALGAMKSRVTRQNWIRAGFETLLVGGIAAVAAYVVGVVLGGLA